MKWTRKAAEQGHIESWYNLGVSYHDGEGVPKDYVEAEKWFRKAAEQGHFGAQNALYNIDGTRGSGCAGAVLLTLLTGITVLFFLLTAFRYH